MRSELALLVRVDSKVVYSGSNVDLAQNELGLGEIKLKFKSKNFVLLSSILEDVRLVKFINLKKFNLN